MTSDEPENSSSLIEGVAVSAISRLIDETITPLIKGVKNLGAGIKAKTQVTLETCFTEYTIRCYERYSKTKTLLYRDKPVNLKNYYVRTDLISAKKHVKEEDFLENIKTTRRAVISGTAGSGKSTFCKSIFIEMVEKRTGIFPIFIELRYINQENPKNLFKFISGTLSKIEGSFTEKHLDLALKAGKLLLILDGFDEIDTNKRQQYEKEILEISNNYKNLLIIVSSRIDGRFESWEEFQTYHIQRLDKAKSMELVRKLEYDEEVKHKFLCALNESLYEKHASFASNPLLLTMMLLTYEQIAEIPNKIHLFYEQAFLTLFNKHDAFKSQYKRNSSSELPLDEFKNVLSTFCALSYLNNLYSFPETKILEIIEKSIKTNDKEVAPESFLRDLLENVCIMQRDGTSYTFTHRSFQEYFSALFIANYTGKNKFEILEKLARNNERDLVIPMLYDMRPDLVEKEWIIPRLKKIVASLTKLEKMPRDEVYDIRLMQFFFNEIIVHNDSVAYANNANGNPNIGFLRILNHIYNNEITLFIKAKKPKKTPRIKEATEDLVSHINSSNLQSISLNPKRISKESIDYIISAKAHSHTASYIEYCKKKLNSLQSKQKQKDNDLDTLLLG